MHYGMQVWDPVLIIAQIISLQCLFYLTLGVFDAILIGEARVAPCIRWGPGGTYPKPYRPAIHTVLP
jgi:hypothetical protein